ncbi:Uma2 family endonuclease [Lyngbya sp. PCC 8106]|uniref:Uma2 family endonuclease n=1 Tax=Lyngbya sp. (strain PCC 8106) TaxID=313612 RepID=UPI0000EACF4F|nr:Uma2 family endonuclease [Lyngbya sp. PCC 8106]EAW33602.1 hypothetical protein L8106_29415 [Lyngbya sp. PCC 8106]
MIADFKAPLMTAEEYLKWEEKQPIKYEYINGKVWAMMGGSLPHNSIALNLASALKSHLRKQGCKVFMADAKVGVSSHGPFHYPDIMVTYDSRDQTARKVVYYPCLIVEVLSPSTEGFDRGKKFRHYRRIETLKEYVLVDAERMNVECYRLNEHNKWELTSYSVEEVATNATELEIQLTCVNFRSSISSLYEDVVCPDENLEDSVSS